MRHFGSITSMRRLRQKAWECTPAYCSKSVGCDQHACCRPLSTTLSLTQIQLSMLFYLYSGGLWPCFCPTTAVVCDTVQEPCHTSLWALVEFELSEYLVTHHCEPWWSLNSLSTLSHITVSLGGVWTLWVPCHTPLWALVEFELSEYRFPCYLQYCSVNCVISLQCPDGGQERSVFQRIFQTTFWKGRIMLGNSSSVSTAHVIISGHIGAGSNFLLSLSMNWQKRHSYLFHSV